MPDCRYCDATFEEEGAYLEHLEDAHADELGPIDRRRIADDGGGGIDPAPVALGGVLLVSVGLVAYLILFAGSGGGSGPGGGGGPTPHGVGQVHYHGTIEMTVDGEPVDFGRAEYVHPRRHPAFHFDRPNDPNWHVHARGVTLAYAMATLGIDVSATSVTFEGTTYREGAGANVTIQVNGESVDPGAYVLQPEDRVRIAVESG